jgi:exodeoxyribonuclease V alpha subunit
MIRHALEQACRQGDIRLLDLHIGLFLEKLAGGGQPGLLLAATLASAAVGSGHVCLPLERAAEFGIEPELIPEVSPWRKRLSAAGVVGRPGEALPLVLDPENRLYLLRFFRYEDAIGADLLKRAAGVLERDEARARGLLDLLFPDRDRVDMQKIAAALALLRRLLVISGGPGTGKTHTVARLLALVQALAGRDLRIGLAAPTGKAAARLEESIRRARQDLPPELAENIPEQAQTLHRLLGYHPGTDAFLYNRYNPLSLDLLVLDEASMIDVVMMNALVQALPPRARLVMLGDHNQLTSVEAGSLFGDICSHGGNGWSREVCGLLGKLTGYELIPSAEHETFADSIVLLQESYRFRKKSGIGEFAGAVRNGKWEEIRQLLQGQVHEDFRFEQGVSGDSGTWLTGLLLEGFRECFSARGPREALAALGRFRLLCAVRDGQTGVSGVNRIAEQVFRGRGLIRGHETWYQGRPVMIRSNHYGLQLFNGDTGILWPDDEGKLRAWFMRPDGRIRKIALSALPDHDTAYAMTVHKAQGSEFDEVVFILPRADSRVLSRELMYTGITRARKKLTLCGDIEVLKRCIGRHVSRYSGLRDRLWNQKRTP